jgi:glucose/arabinose dehydrogenase
MLVLLFQRVVLEQFGGVLRIRAYLVGLSILLSCYSPLSTAAEKLDLPPGTRLELVAKPQGVVWGIEPLTEDNALVTTKEGRLLVVSLKGGPIKSISGVPAVKTSAQGGLLDVRMSPRFSSDQRIFLTYSKDTDSGATTALASAVLDIKQSRLQNVNTVFVGKTDNSGSVHFGSRIAFDDAGHIYFGIGDRGERDRAQDLSWHNGKIIRLNLDGTVPKDNPFVGRKGALPEIYSFGHRNPQGIYYSRKLKKLFNSEHGPRGGDEINEVKAGRNYGWPVITYGREYYGPKIGVGAIQQGMEQPLKYYVPSIAPSSLIVYESSKIKSLSGQFILGALVLQHLNVVSPDGKNEFRYLKGLAKRIRQVRESPAGALLIGTDSGEIYRLATAP